MVVQTRRTSNTNWKVAVPSDPIWRLSVEQYHQMIENGILTDDDPVELLEGWLVTKMPKNPSYRLSTQLTREFLARLLPEGWYVEDQEPITILDSEPEPDISIVRGQRRDYADHHPSAEDVALVIEVSDTTLQRDRTIKKQIYARANLVAYWIINIAEQQIEVYTLPSGDVEHADYQHRMIYTPGDTIPLVLNEQLIGELQASDILP